MKPNNSLLKNALLANAIFSGTSVIAIFVFIEWLKIQLDSPTWLLYLILFGLTSFSIQLFLMVKFQILANKLALQVVISDISWVVITAIAATFYTEQITSSGLLLVWSVNLIILLLIYFQYQGLKKARIDD